MDDVLICCTNIEIKRRNDSEMHLFSYATLHGVYQFDPIAINIVIMK